MSQIFVIVSFMNAWLVGNCQPTRAFAVAFLTPGVQGAWSAKDFEAVLEASPEVR